MSGARTAVELDALQSQLERRIGSLGSVVIAFSGGVDSSLVAALGARALGARALAVTAVSAALATGELDLHLVVVAVQQLGTAAAEQREVGGRELEVLLGEHDAIAGQGGHRRILLPTP